MTVHSNESGVMNAVSTRPISASPTTPAAAAGQHTPSPAHHHHHSHNHINNHQHTLHLLQTQSAAAAAAAVAAAATVTLTPSTTQSGITTITTAPPPLATGPPPPLTLGAPSSLTASVANAVAAAAAAAAAVSGVNTSCATSIASNAATCSALNHSSMAVTSTVPPGARSISPCAVAAVSAPTATPYSNTPAVSAATPASALPPSAVVSALGGTPPAVVPPPGGPPTGAGRCCETGRTIYTDPVSGQTLCSCQYDMLSYQRLAAGGLVAAGPGGMPLGVYPEGMSAYLSGMTDQPPFYANPAGLDLKENLVAGAAPWPYPSVYHPYDAAFAGYPFNSYGMDLNGARRKNATRETTSTLKAWLNEHKKNPYPTKGEKIMLAIITKMTLTQVSTWFANARRRLKKENKMTWEPRNRVDDDDANIDDDDHKSTDDNDLLDAKDSGLGSNEDKDRSGRLDMLGGERPGECNNSEWSGSRPGSPNGSPDLYERGNPMMAGSSGPGGHPLFHPAALHHHFRPPAGSPPDIAAYHHHQQQLLQHHHQQQQAQQNTLHAAGVAVGGVSLGSTSASLAAKPRIWSLADMASKDGKDSGSGHVSKDSHSPPGNELTGTHPALYGHPGQHATPGKILSPLAARIPNYAPYVRPDLYRSFYGSSLGVGPTPEFLEHQRNFGASLAAHNGLSMNPLLWKAAVSGAAASGAHFAPLSLTTNNNHNATYVVAPPSGASPSASSTSSSIGCDVVQLPSGGSAQPPLNSQQHHLGPISGNSTSSSTSSNSGKMSPSINVTSLGNSNGASGKP